MLACHGLGKRKWQWNSKCPTWTRTMKTKQNQKFCQFWNLSVNISCSNWSGGQYERIDIPSRWVVFKRYRYFPLYPHPLTELSPLASRGEVRSSASAMAWCAHLSCLLSCSPARSCCAGRPAGNTAISRPRRGMWGVLWWPRLPPPPWLTLPPCCTVVTVPVPCYTEFPAGEWRCCCPPYCWPPRSASQQEPVPLQRRLPPCRPTSVLTQTLSHGSDCRAAAPRIPTHN